MEEELLRTLGAVVYLVLLSMDGKDVLLQLIGLNKHWGERTEGKQQSNDWLKRFTQEYMANWL